MGMTCSTVSGKGVLEWDKASWHVKAISWSAWHSRLSPVLQIKKKKSIGRLFCWVLFRRHLIVCFCKNNQSNFIEKKGFVSLYWIKLQKGHSVIASITLTNVHKMSEVETWLVIQFSTLRWAARNCSAWGFTQACLRGACWSVRG